MAALDMDYCMILIDKIINPLTPMDQIMNLVTHLLETVTHPEMKKIAKKIINPALNQEQKRLLKEEFRNFDHGGANDLSGVDYEGLIDKFVNPNLADSEYKPTMMALLHGDLDQDRRNVVSSIVSCKDAEEKAKLVKKFKSFFIKEREEKAAKAKELADIAEARRAKKAEEEAKALLEVKDLLEFSDDGMTLIYNLINKKVPPEERTKIYDRLMEPDVDAEVKNLAITLISITKFSLMSEAVTKFIKERENKKVADAKLKENLANRKKFNDDDRKNWQLNRKKELLATKEKNERMMKRDLMLKMRATQNKREKAEGSSKFSQEEKNEMRRAEMEKMREEMKSYKEKQREVMMSREREDRQRTGWLVTPYDENYNTEVDVVVDTYRSTVAAEEMELFNKALEAFKVQKEAALKEMKDVKEKLEEKEVPAPAPAAPAPVATSPPAPKAEEMDPDFAKFYAGLSKPELTEKEEMTQLTGLIKEKRSALVKQLVVRMAVEARGKSPIFKALSKKFAEEIKKKEADTKEVASSEVVKKEEAKKEVKKDEVTKEVVKSEEGKKLVGQTAQGVKDMKKPELAVTGKESVEQNREGEKKRKVSGESVGEKEKKKIKVDEDASAPALMIGAFVTKASSADSKPSEKESTGEKKHKKHKHKDGEREKEDEASKNKKHKKDKDREREKNGMVVKVKDGEKHKKHKEKSHKGDKEKGDIRSSVDSHKEKGDIRSSVDSHKEKGDIRSSVDSHKEKGDIRSSVDSHKEKSDVRSSVDSQESQDKSSRKASVDEDSTEYEPEVKPPKPYLSMASGEIIQFFNENQLQNSPFKLKKLNGYVKARNMREVYRSVKKREEQRSSRDSSREGSMSRSRSPSKEQKENVKEKDLEEKVEEKEQKKQRAGPASKKEGGIKKPGPTSATTTEVKKKSGPASSKKKSGPASSKKIKERSRSGSRDSTTSSKVSQTSSKSTAPTAPSPVQFSRSPSRSTSRSPVRYLSRTPSPSSARSRSPSPSPSPS